MFFNAVKAPLLPLSLHLLKPLHELFLSASLSSTQLPHPGPRSACDLRLTSFPASGYLRGGVPVLHSPGLWHVVDQLHTAERHHQPLHARSVIKAMKMLKTRGLPGLKKPFESIISDTKRERSKWRAPALQDALGPRVQGEVELSSDARF